jgi:CRISPR-associated protein Cmr6
VNLPLYRSIREHYLGAKSTPNASLIFDRFVEWGDGWEAGGQHKREVFEKVADYPAGKVLLNAYLERQDQQVKTLGGVTLEAQTLGRFVSGRGSAHPFETGFVWHRLLGVPYLPGSGVKGAVRAWAEQWLEEWDDAIRFFGAPGDQGALIVLDALPTKPPRLETDVMTPHYGEYYREGKPPGDYLSPNPVPFLAVAAGQDFRFSLLPAIKDDQESLQRGTELLKEVLEEIGAGGKTSAGYGTFAVKAPKKDLQVEQMRMRIKAQNPNDIGSVPNLVSELANLPAGESRKELAELLHSWFLSDSKRRRKHREKDWFKDLQRMREN